MNPRRLLSQVMSVLWMPRSVLTPHRRTAGVQIMISCIIDCVFCINWCFWALWASFSDDCLYYSLWEVMETCAVFVLSDVCFEWSNFNSQLWSFWSMKHTQFVFFLESDWCVRVFVSHLLEVNAWPSHVKFMSVLMVFSVSVLLCLNDWKDSRSKVENTFELNWSDACEVSWSEIDLESEVWHVL